jgi:drug/metabolite transporter (DMT)-like permease
MPGAAQPRRWTVIGSGLLCGALALVVIFTNRHAFDSPLAVVVVAAIGLVAVLMQLRLRNRAQGTSVQSPIWLNVLGIAFALGALLADLLRWSVDWAQLMALGAVSCFAISSALILQAFRKQRMQ